MQLLFASVLLTNGFIIQQHPSKIIAKPPSLQSMRKNPPRTTQIFRKSAEKHDDNKDIQPEIKNNAQVDSNHRRQILLSMLVSSGVSTTAMSNAWATTSDNAVEESIASNQKLSVANSLRGDGNTKLIVPPMDNRIYETMTLDNGLRVLLCSDLSSFTAAAAMDVHVGASSDPDSVPGLAHFCEVGIFILWYFYYFCFGYISNHISILPFFFFHLKK